MKTQLSIHQAATFLHVSSVTLRRWEEKGLLVPKRTKGNQRRYPIQVVKTFQQRQKTFEKIIPANDVQKTQTNAENQTDRQAEFSETAIEQFNSREIQQTSRYTILSSCLFTPIQSGFAQCFIPLSSRLILNFGLLSLLCVFMLKDRISDPRFEPNLLFPQAVSQIHPTRPSNVLGDSTNSLTGKVVLLAGQTTTTILSSSVTSNAIIYIKNDTFATLPFIISHKQPGVGFNLSISTPMQKDMKFRWWIIN